MVFAELGLFGFILFIIIKYLIFSEALNSIRCFRDNNENTLLQAMGIGFLASFVSYIVFAQFISGLMLNSLYMILISLIFSISKFKKLSLDDV